MFVCLDSVGADVRGGVGGQPPHPSGLVSRLLSFHPRHR